MATSVPPSAGFPVTVSMLPPLERFVTELQDIWDSHRLTNAGPKVQAFESALRDRLGTSHCLTFCNGGAALLAGIAALKLEGEVVTTPFTFPGTTHCLALNRLTPVFADVDPVTYNLDPAAIEAAITPRASAILAVHVFGNPCDVEAIEEIACRRGLKVIYDGAHAFGVRVRGKNLADYGDVQMFSFNATKLLTTGEGGCLVYKDATLEDDLRRLRRWGMLEEGDVTMPGANAMLSEIHAALGICNLEQLEEERRQRQQVVAAYREHLAGLRGVELPSEPSEVEPALTYFVVRITPEFGCSRDALLQRLRDQGVLARRYFYPLCSRLPCYSHLPGAEPGATPQAVRIAEEVISLPLYGGLGSAGAEQVCQIIATAQADR
ncbi:DegT/DnrJ/EryC1/StrS family aminotransferase [Verrucomicrobium sp. BvORR034]|uniref:DegT/DnrJ/EryC1/StrS family aminotransferase n=1 Tax=Verrucomicrobium sp. BvORR034 TaxID=1396418 RepID=UPI0006792597|nr:DegT/DnrJ/EryC1/StrS family aminotransferase [Verrucomicrobium sp. BvORR034]